jgi:hypothetical protein
MVYQNRCMCTLMETLNITRMVLGQRARGELDFLDKETICNNCDQVAGTKFALSQ